MVPLKRLASFRNDVVTEERALLALEHLESWTGEIVSGAELGRAGPGAAGAAAVEPGDVLFGKLRPYLAKGITITEPLAASTELICMRPRPDIDPRWLGYVTRSQRFVEWSVASSEGTKMPRTSWEKLGVFEVAKPPLADQRAIADYLDVETARIDALIDKKLRLIGLLEERMWSFRTRMLLGLSGPGGEVVEHAALGTVSADREVVPLRRVVPRIGVGLVINPSTYVTDHGIPFIHGSNVRDGWIDRSNMKFMSGTDSLSLPASRLRMGDVVVVRAGYPGRAAVIDESLDGAQCASILILRRSEAVLPEYLAAYFNSGVARSQISAHQYGAAQEQVNVSHIVDFFLPMLDLSRQAECVAAIGEGEASMGRVKRRLLTQLNLLAEHRQALITAAIAGESLVLGGT
jgi:type I restriction enzyme S subunit